MLPFGHGRGACLPCHSRGRVLTARVPPLPPGVRLLRYQYIPFTTIRGYATATTLSYLLPTACSHVKAPPLLRWRFWIARDRPCAYRRLAFAAHAACLPAERIRATTKPCRLQTAVGVAPPQRLCRQLLALRRLRVSLQPSQDRFFIYSRRFRRHTTAFYLLYTFYLLPLIPFANIGGRPLPTRYLLS